MLTYIVGLHNAQGPPVPIPNTEVKLCGAENTRLEAVREDRARPTQYSSVAQSVERMTVNHDVTGSSPVRGAKKKRSHRVRSFLFALQSKQTCDIMIKISSAYRLSVAKLVVDEEKRA